MPLEIRTTQVRSAHVMEVTGRLDSVAATTFGQSLNDVITPEIAKKQDGLDATVAVLLILTGVEYISAAALREMMSSKKKLNMHGGDVILVAPSTMVQETLELADLYGFFKTFATEQLALASFVSLADDSQE